MKLLIAGLGLIGLGLALVLFTDLNPTTPFIAGAISTFLGVIDGIRVGTDHGPPVSASDTSNAVDLIRDVRNHQ
jgi:hypothetical protein